MGAVLQQNGRPVAFFSKTLSAVERRYSVTEKETLAVVAGFGHFRPYLHGVHTRCWTDHAAVVKILTTPEGTGRRARWADKMSEFDFVLRHRPGKANCVADALTRRENDPAPHAEDSESSRPVVQALLGSVDSDPYLFPVKHFLESGVAVGDTWAKRRAVRLRARKFIMQDGILMKEDTDGVLKICVPAQDVEQIIQEYHSTTHFGRDLTVSAIRRIYWWPTMRRDIWEHIQRCSACQGFGAAHKTSALQPLLTSQPLEIVELDYVGPFPRSSQGNLYMLSSTCVLTRWIECQAFPSAGTTQALSFLTDRIFTRFGLPLVVLTDRGTPFGQRFKAALERLGVQHLRTSAARPQAIGLEERSHGIVVDRIRRLIAEDSEAEWDRYITQAAFAVNTRVTPTHPISPLEAMIGITARRPTELRIITDVLGLRDPQALRARIQDTTEAARDVDAVHSRLSQLGALQDECARIKEERAAHMKAVYDSKLKRPVVFPVGASVRIRRPGRIGKLQRRWEGPATVLWRQGNTYGVLLAGEVVSNVDRLRAWL